jgi:chemotaxis signal transduction protein
LGLPHEEPTEKTRIIAIDSGFFETGFLVDEVVESIEVPLSKIEPALLTLPVERAKYLEGQCQVDDKLIAIVNVEKVSEKTVQTGKGRDGMFRYRQVRSKTRKGI